MSRRVLVIDDEAAIATALALRLRAAGYDVETANDGLAGLACAAARTPDLVLLDIRMPGIDGFEVQRRLRDEAATAAVPVIFLSANVQEHVRETVLASGAARFITKPYDAHDVITAVADVLERHGAVPAAKEAVP